MTILTSFIPPHAVICWLGDDGYIYTAIPTKLGEPLIQRHAISESGLSKALNTLRIQQAEYPTKGGYAKVSIDHPSTKRNKPLLKFKDETRANAAAVLKKMGIT